MVSREEYDGFSMAMRMLLVNCYVDEYSGDLPGFQSKRSFILGIMDHMVYADTPLAKGEMVKHHALHVAETILEGVESILAAELP